MAPWRPWGKLPLHIAGVPEAFNMPFDRAKFQKPGAKFVSCPGGSGEMLGLLETGKVDAAFLLTECAVAAVANGKNVRLLAPLVQSPLRWGCVVRDECPSSRLQKDGLQDTAGMEKSKEPPKSLEHGPSMNTAANELEASGLPFSSSPKSNSAKGTAADPAVAPVTQQSIASEVFQTNSACSSVSAVNLKREEKLVDDSVETTKVSPKNEAREALKEIGEALSQSDAQLASLTLSNDTNEQAGLRNDGALSEIESFSPMQRRWAVSRLGSGSHMMGAVVCHRSDIPDPSFVVAKNFDGMCKSVREGHADLFLWEVFTTRGLLRSEKRAGHGLQVTGIVTTPWPAFCVAVRADCNHRRLEDMRAAMAAFFEAAEKFKRSSHSITAICELYGMTEEDATEWMKGLEYAKKDDKFKEEHLKLALDALCLAGIVQEGKSVDIVAMCVDGVQDHQASPKT